MSPKSHSQITVLNGSEAQRQFDQEIDNAATAIKQATSVPLPSFHLWGNQDRSVVTLLPGWDLSAYKEYSQVQLKAGISSTIDECLSVAKKAHSQKDHSSTMKNWRKLPVESIGEYGQQIEKILNTLRQITKTRCFQALLDHRTAESKLYAYKRLIKSPKSSLLSTELGALRGYVTKYRDSSIANIRLEMLDLELTNLHFTIQQAKGNLDKKLIRSDGSIHPIPKSLGVNVPLEKTVEQNWIYDQSTNETHLFIQVWQQSDSGKFRLFCDIPATSPMPRSAADLVFFEPMAQLAGQETRADFVSLADSMTYTISRAYKEILCNEAWKEIGKGNNLLVNIANSLALPTSELLKAVTSIQSESLDEILEQYNNTQAQNLSEDERAGIEPHKLNSEIKEKKLLVNMARLAKLFGLSEFTASFDETEIECLESIQEMHNKIEEKNSVLSWRDLVHGRSIWMSVCDNAKNKYCFKAPDEAGTQTSEEAVHGTNQMETSSLDNANKDGNDSSQAGEFPNIVRNQEIRSYVQQNELCRWMYERYTETMSNVDRGIEVTDLESLAS